MLLRSPQLTNGISDQVGVAHPPGETHVFNGLVLNHTKKERKNLSWKYIYLFFPN
jgi:hypothetical protein